MYQYVCICILYVSQLYLNVSVCMRIYMCDTWYVGSARRIPCRRRGCYGVSVRPDWDHVRLLPTGGQDMVAQHREACRIAFREACRIARTRVFRGASATAAGGQGRAAPCSTSTHGLWSGPLTTRRRRRRCFEKIKIFGFELECVLHRRCPHHWQSHWQSLSCPSSVSPGTYQNIHADTGVRIHADTNSLNRCKQDTTWYIQIHKTLYVVYILCQISVFCCMLHVSACIPVISCYLRADTYSIHTHTYTFFNAHVYVCACIFCMYVHVFACICAYCICTFAYTCYIACIFCIKSC